MSQSTIKFDLGELTTTQCARLLSKFIRKATLTPEQFEILNTSYDELTEFDDHPLYGGATDHHKDIVGKYDHALLKPAVYQQLRDFATKMESSSWQQTEIDAESDIPTWEQISENERDCVRKVLAFFAVGDTLVKDRIAIFADEFPLPECKDFIDWQTVNEGVHQRVYNNYLDALVKDKIYLADLVNAYKDPEFAPIKKKVDWLGKIISVENDSRGEMVVGQVCTEAIMFAASFAILLKFRAPYMRALVLGNEFIRRDETLHFRFYAELLRLMPDRPSDERIAELLTEATEIELEFAEYVVPEGVKYITKDRLIQHVKANTNQVCEMLDINPIYFDQKGNVLLSPLLYMNTLESEQKINFFEGKATEYNTKQYKVDFNNLFPPVKKMIEFADEEEFIAAIVEGEGLSKDRNKDIVKQQLCLAWDHLSSHDMEGLVDMTWTLKDVHRIAMNHVIFNNGEFSNGYKFTVIDSGKVMYPTYETVEILESAVQGLIDDYNRDFSALDKGVEKFDKDKIRVAARFILDLLYIHPFSDGNGRTARLIMAHLIGKMTTPINREEYLKSIYHYRQTGDVSVFVDQFYR
ncbi:ORF20 [Ostreid herpesvirus 1]|uniref:Ribonucleoside-diphosphate reductase small chain n=1 Tax=Ostreid herpesvirus 1 (isolate France) TaxID=654903 RepID=RIR2_OSHVF|nr:ORF20 [Ostreid herpesvirus 1]Q6R7K3.1 RecName: Full=Ribonucleoside-diphosphate reductase small chain [Ostreid herpesvirus 1 (isolate France)]AAS00912.1 ORF20 [Ostreid herpesvirus 1]AVL26947.1 ORF20 [Ostreid herpesvirus 1]